MSTEYKPTYHRGGLEGEQFEVPEEINSGKGGVLAYLRKSTTDRHATKFETQIKEILDYVNQNPLNFNTSRGVGVRRFFVDQGVSGGAEIHARKGLTQLINELDILSKEPFSLHVVVYDIPRLSRDSSVGQSLKKIFSDKAATLHLANRRTAVLGKEEKLIFDMMLSVAETERLMTSARVKDALSRKDWDKRKGFGWKDDREKSVLDMIKTNFEQGKTVSEISIMLKELKIVRTVVRKDKSEIECVEWGSDYISYLVRKNKMKWPGITSEMIFRESLSRDEFIKKYLDSVIDGKKVTMKTVDKFYPKEDWKLIGIKKVRQWITEQKTVDDIIQGLNDQVKKPGGWTRQTAWRFRENVAKQMEAEKKGLIEIK